MSLYETLNFGKRITFMYSVKCIIWLVLKPPQPPHPHTPTTLDDHGGCGVVGV